MCQSFFHEYWPYKWKNHKMKNTLEILQSRKTTDWTLTMTSIVNHMHLYPDLIQSPYWERQRLQSVCWISWSVFKCVVLLGIANSSMSETRQEMAIGCIPPSIKKHGKIEFTKAKGDLFGQDQLEGYVGEESCRWI